MISRIRFAASYCARLSVSVVLLCVLLSYGSRILGVILPEGAQVAYAVRHSDYAAAVYVVDLERGLTTRLIDGVFDRMISFAPDGQLVFSRYSDQQHNIIFRTSDDSNEVQLSPDSGSDQYPVWSPDGAQVAFMSFDASHVNLYAMNSDGSERRNLSQRMEPHTNVYPVWLPDNTHIMYATLAVGQSSTFIVNSRTGELVNFTYNTGIRSVPAWSPDGTHIAYVLYSALRSTIYVAQVESNGDLIAGTTHEITDNDRAFNTSPRWSPDSQRLVYVSANAANPEIYVIEANGTNMLNLSQNPAVDNFPVWSPDGTQIAFLSDRDGTPQIYVMNADGTQQRRVSYYVASGAYGGALSAVTWLP